VRRGALRARPGERTRPPATEDATEHGKRHGPRDTAEAGGRREEEKKRKGARSTDDRRQTTGDGDAAALAESFVRRCEVAKTG
jgi:hypothetical protein